MLIRRVTLPSNIITVESSHTKVRAFAAKEPKARLEEFYFDLPEIGYEQVDVKVAYCGICQSDVSMINNDWAMTQYPLVPGHEIVGEVMRIGPGVKGVQVGDKVGLGWFTESCMHCHHCLNGNHHYCSRAEQTIVGRYGGFADIVRGHWSWMIPLPKETNLAKAGPLLCGGITVFAPIFAHIKPTYKVGVIGIGGLGHLALQFLRSWGCEVIAFSSNKSKYDEIIAMGATRVVDSMQPRQVEALEGQLNFIISTVNVPMEWDIYLKLLAPKGELHTVGVVMDPMAIPVMSLINGEKKVGGSPSAGPGLIKTMFDFCIRHNVYPSVEEYPMEDVNEALLRLQEGKARYRIVLKNNW